MFFTHFFGFCFLSLCISLQDADAITQHDCPSNWVPLFSSCYYFSTTKATWSKARSSCLTLGGDLAVPKNSDENNAIWNAAVKQHGQTHPWIGLLRYQDKKFHTVHGSEPGYTAWHSGEPNNLEGVEDCVHYYYRNSDKWNDIKCSHNYNFICERPKLTCPTNWVPLISSCYYFSTTKATWSKARSSCLLLGGDLVVPENSNENNAVWNAAVKQHGQTHPWIGLVRLADQKFYTIHGSEPRYTAWHSGEPNNFEGVEYCVHYYYGANDKWNDIRCTHNYNFICKRSKL